jgi:hypothetical protein
MSGSKQLLDCTGDTNGRRDSQRYRFAGHVAAAAALVACEREELGALAPGELSRLAGEFGSTAWDLQDLVAQDPGGAELLKRRLNALGVSRADVERIALGLARDLERTCWCWGEKSACQHDLTQDPDGTAWRESIVRTPYPLESMRRTKVDSLHEELNAAHRPVRPAAEAHNAAAWHHCRNRAFDAHLVWLAGG